MCCDLLKCMFGCIGMKFPPKSFDDSPPPPNAPDYNDPKSWLAYPGTESEVELLAEGVEKVPEAERKADCFYVYPSSFFAPQWNADITDPAA